MASAANSVPHPTVISVDPFIPAAQQKGLHNRWHPDIPAVATVKPGQVFKVECHDWTGAQIGNNDSADDIKNVDIGALHTLSGPVAVEGAEPGDCLVVDILDGCAGMGQGWSVCQGIQEPRPEGHLGFHGVYATSRHIPGVRFAGIPHPGLIGTAPSAELLALWNKRETGLIAQHPNAVPAVAHPPEAKGVLLTHDVDQATREKIEREGARTIPGREHGGNVDIKNLSKGSRCYFPVYVKGANLSLGDLHFSQGDGEISLCGAIEMAGIVTMNTSIIKGGVEKFALKQPIFLPSPVDPVYSEKLIFQGLSVDINGDGKQYDMDATVAYKQAALNAISYLEKLGYTRQQAYLLLSAAPIDSHVAALVDSPNACVTLAIPTAIFEHDILPRPEGLTKRDFGQVAVRSDGLVE